MVLGEDTFLFPLRLEEERPDSDGWLTESRRVMQGLRGRFGDGLGLRRRAR